MPRTSPIVTRLDLPDAHEGEVVVFGRGEGESVLVHLGHGDWLVVDSTVVDPQGEPDSIEMQPAALWYLRRIGADVRTAIRLIVASHWDADHILGIADVLRVSERAEFATAAAIQDPRLIKWIKGSGDPSAPTRMGKRFVDEFAGVFADLGRRKRRPVWASRATLLWESHLSRVWALSPSGTTQTAAVIRMVENANRGDDVRLSRRNHLSVVLWIEAGAQRLLLGGDLERAPREPWRHVIESPGRRGAQAAGFKVPHHGAETGHVDEVWSEMLVPQPWAVVTRFNGSGLPAATDLERIRERAGRTFIVGAAATASKRDDITDALIAANTASYGLHRIRGPLGFVRLRAPLDGTAAWTADPFGEVVTV